MKRILCAVAIGLAAASLAACTTSTLKDDTVTLHMAVGGANVNSATGLSLGYGQAKGQFVPTRSSDGKTILAGVDTCGRQQQPATYASLGGNATASAAGSAATGPQAAVAISDVSATGEAARLLALGAPGSAPTPAAITAANDCSKSIPETASATAAR